MELFAHLVQEISKQQPSSKTSSLQIIDSTTIPLNKTWFPWAKFRKTKSGIKLHLNLCYLDKNNQYPESFTITNAEEHDRNQFELLVNKTEATYVVDRGYFDYKLLDCYTMMAISSSQGRSPTLESLFWINSRWTILR